MTLATGSRIGPYEIQSPLGEGGMGVVFRARDTKLNRDVAIKVLPEAFSNDPDRLSRFQREAQVLASLNHPNIAQIYGMEESDNTRCIVMELVEGETLQERLKRRPISLDEALPIAKQIAEALEAAHERGIIHRDLKPANIKITPDGKVKVLDFGLAKPFQEQIAATLSNSPTLMSESVPGVVLGTPAYMSPEQARGEPVDKRADVWSFGVVLWEMLTGKRLYQGKTTSDVLAAVIRDEPDLSKAPAKVRPLLNWCLEKDPRRRLRDVGDAMWVIENTPEARAASSRFVWTRAAVVAVLLAFAVLAFIHFREAPPEARVMTTSILPPENISFDFATGLNPPALSPDGRRVVFGTRGANATTTQLWVRPLDSPTAQPLAGTEDAQFPFWSPDSRSVAFFADGKLKRIDAMRGPALAVAEAPNPRGGSWSPQGIIIFAPNVGGPLQRVVAGGGMPTLATTLDGRNDYSHSFPWFLPDGRHFLFEDQTQAGINDVMLRVGALDSQEVKTLGPANSNGVYSSGYLLYLRENTLMAQPFDEKRLAVAGEAQPVAEQVRSALTPNAVAVFSVSREGLLAYQAGEAGGQQLTWFDRNGKPFGTLGEAADFFSLAFSPDRKSVAATRLGQNNDTWIYDVARGLATRFTFSRTVERDAAWSPDGRSIVYRSNARGPFDLYRKAADGTGSEELLYADGVPKIATSWSPDGRLLLFYRIDPKTQRDIWVLPLGPGAPSKPFPWLVTPSNENSAMFSPDGRSVAYASEESGRNEIYAAPFRGPGGMRQISTGGGTHPRWRGDGKELYYVGLNGVLMAAEVSAKGAGIEVGAVRPLGVSVMPNRPNLYDVSADGQRFLVASSREQQLSEPLVLVYNWPLLLKKK